MLKSCVFVLWYGSQLSVLKESCQQGEALAGFRWKANPFNEYRFQPSLATAAAAGLLLCTSSGTLRTEQSSAGIVLKNPNSLSQCYSCIAACLVNIYISMCILSVNFWDKTSFWLTHVAKDSVKIECMKLISRKPLQGGGGAVCSSSSFEIIMWGGNTRMGSSSSSSSSWEDPPIHVFLLQ